jgi:hypothetical protein
LVRQLLSSSTMTEAYFNLTDDSTDQLDGPLSDPGSRTEPDRLAITQRPSQKADCVSTRIDRFHRWLASGLALLQAGWSRGIARSENRRADGGRSLL